MFLKELFLGTRAVRVGELVKRGIPETFLTSLDDAQIADLTAARLAYDAMQRGVAPEAPYHPAHPYASPLLIALFYEIPGAAVRFQNFEQILRENPYFSNPNVVKAWQSGELAIADIRTGTDATRQVAQLQYPNVLDLVERGELTLEDSLVLAARLPQQHQLGRMAMSLEDASPFLSASGQAVAFRQQLIHGEQHLTDQQFRLLNTSTYFQYCEKGQLSLEDFTLLIQNPAYIAGRGIKLCVGNPPALRAADYVRLSPALINIIQEDRALQTLLREGVLTIDEFNTIAARNIFYINNPTIRNLWFGERALLSPQEMVSLDASLVSALANLYALTVDDWALLPAEMANQLIDRLLDKDSDITLETVREIAQHTGGGLSYTVFFWFGDDAIMTPSEFTALPPSIIKLLSEQCYMSINERVRQGDISIAALQTLLNDYPDFFIEAVRHRAPTLEAFIDMTPAERAQHYFEFRLDVLKNSDVRIRDALANEHITPQALLAMTEEERDTFLNDIQGWREARDAQQEIAERAEADFAGSQSTHARSVDASVSRSAKKLWETYSEKLADSNGHLDSEKLDAIIREIREWSEALPNSADPSNQAAAAKRCIRRMDHDSVFTHVDVESGVSTKTSLALFWLAIHDEKNDMCNAENGREGFIYVLYEIQRGYNLHLTKEGTHDDGWADRPICTGGTFNKIYEGLGGRHPDIEVVFKTRDTALAGLPNLIQDVLSDYLASLPEAEQVHVINRLSKYGVDGEEFDGSEEWFAIRDVVALAYFEMNGDVYYRTDEQWQASGEKWEDLKEEVKQQLFEQDDDGKYHLRNTPPPGMEALHEHVVGGFLTPVGMAMLEANLPHLIQQAGDLERDALRDKVAWEAFEKHGQDFFAEALNKPSFLWRGKQDAVREALFDEDGHFKDAISEAWRPFKDLIDGACRTHEARQTATSTAGNHVTSSSLFRTGSEEPETGADASTFKTPSPGGS